MPNNSLVDDDDNDDNNSVDSDDEEDGAALPRGKTDGIAYQPKRILVEGWLHKKGTGKDWLGSRSWKPRWTRLVVRSCAALSEYIFPLYCVLTKALLYCDCSTLDGKGGRI